MLNHTRTVTIINQPVKKNLDFNFGLGLMEAEQLFKQNTETRMDREKEAGKIGFKGTGGGKPSQYVKIKTNKPFGNCPVYTLDPGEIQPCDCKHPEHPCDDDNSCLNRMLMFECHPSVCPSKDKCCNMRFQKRQYPQLECFR